MEQTVLGRTGLNVSRLGFGGAPAGLLNYLRKYDPHEPDQRRKVLAAIEAAVHEGITYFDTAADYGDGTSELIIGEGLEVGGPEIVVATKVSSRLPVRASVERSLRNLRRDRLDLIQIHGTVIHDQQADEILASGGMLDQLLALKDEGLVRYVGFTSEDNNAAVFRLIADGRFDTIQITYNLIYQHPHDPVRPFGSLIEANKQDMGIVTMRSLTSGTLQRWIQQVNPANTFDYTPHLLHYVLSDPLVHVALVGMRTPEEVTASAAICCDQSGRIDLCQLHQRFV